MFKKQTDDEMKRKKLKRIQKNKCWALTEVYDPPSFEAGVSLFSIFPVFLLLFWVEQFQWECERETARERKPFNLKSLVPCSCSESI
jgi:hypothetical protein